MNNRRLKLETADKWYSFDLGEFDYFRIVQASGFVTIRFGDGTCGELAGVLKKDNFMFPSPVARGRVYLKSSVAETIEVFASIGVVWKSDTSLDNVSVVYTDLPAGTYDLDFSNFGAFCGLLIRRVSTYLGQEWRGNMGAGVLSNQLSTRILGHNTKAANSYCGPSFTTTNGVNMISAATIHYLETFGFQKLRLVTTAEQTLYINLVRIPPTFPTSADVYYTNVGPASSDSALSDFRDFSLQVTGVDGLGAPVAPDNWEVVIEVSNDDITWTEILTHENTAQGNGETVFVSNRVGRFWRVTIKSLTLGAAASLICHAVGKS